MDTEALYRLSYGLYVLTAKDGRDNGCIINTAAQAADSPELLSVSVNKLNLTHDMIMNTGRFNVSVIDTDADFELFRRFGFRSGRDSDKFGDFAHCRRAPNGILYVTDGVNAYISATADKIVDAGSHTIFIGKITDMKVLADAPSLTYEYYFNHIRPKPTETKPEKTVWRCKICGYEYEGETLPPEFICPLCKHPASDFERIGK